MAAKKKEKQAQQKKDHALSEAAESLTKLPILGPAIWLLAKDPNQKFMFVGDTDFRLMPPIILDQCRLFSRNGIPWAFFTWAKVSDEVDQRFRNGTPKIAPHEWDSGPHIWLVEQVAPFGNMEEMINELRQTVFAGKNISAIKPGTVPGPTTIQNWPAVEEKTTA